MVDPLYTSSWQCSVLRSQCKCALSCCVSFVALHGFLDLVYKMLPHAALLSPRNSLSVISKPSLCAAPIVTKSLFPHMVKNANIFHMSYKDHYFSSWKQSRIIFFGIIPNSDGFCLEIFCLTNFSHLSELGFHFSKGSSDFILVLLQEAESLIHFRKEDLIKHSRRAETAIFTDQ